MCCLGVLDMQNVRGHVRNALRPFVRLMGNLVVSYEY